MKNKISILITAFILSISFNACTDDDNLRFQTVESPEQITFLNNFLSEYVLSEETASNNAERFLWATPDFGAPTAVNYFLETSLDGTFTEENTEVIASTSETQVSVSVSQMIDLAEDKGLSNEQVEDEDGEPVFDENGDPLYNNIGELFFRVRADLGDNAENSPETTSAIQVINVRWLIASTGEEGPVSFRNLFLVGNATAADWNNDNNNMPLVRNPENEDQYTFTGKFLGGDTNEFKLLEVRGQWQPQWGLSDGTLAVNDGTGTDPDAFVNDGEAGYYTIEVDLDATTFEMTAFDASDLTTYPSLSIIGEATALGWDGDTEMTQSSFDEHQWFITGVELADGEMKFRATGNWDINWGASTPISGFGTMGGPNIPVTAGTYDIWLNDIDGSYIFIPVE